MARALISSQFLNGVLHIVMSSAQCNEISEHPVPWVINSFTKTTISCAQRLVFVHVQSRRTADVTHQRTTARLDCLFAMRSHG